MRSACGGEVPLSTHRPQPLTQRNRRPPPTPTLHPSLQAYELRGAGAVIHSHSLSSVLATVLDGEHAPEFRATHLEMVKGIAGQGFYGNLVVPIIENTARECELTGRLRAAIEAYPQSCAVLVRRHGVYVWGKDWIQAKTQAETYDYLFEAAVRLRGLGVDAGVPPPPPPLPAGGGSRTGAATGASNGVAASASGPPAKRPKAGPVPKAVVLDIEGTVAPISFVADVLFPYARARLASHLTAGYGTPAVDAHLAALRAQAAADEAAGVAVPPIPGPDAGRDAVVAAAVANAEAQMNSDRKTNALKALQGDIWAGGFASGALVADLYRDVPDALAEWRARGVKTYIYSSGSRRAQRDLFGHTAAGDLRPYLSGFFDTSSGAKVDAASYDDIALSLGVDSPADLLFATDVLKEAEAAAAAGWGVVVVDRPGNAPLPDGHEFRVVTTMDGLF